MKVPRNHIKRFFGAFGPFFVLSASFGLLVEFAPRLIADEAKCALYEPMSFKTVILLFIFVVFTSGLILLLFGTVDHKKSKWIRNTATWMVRRPSLFLTDTLAPMFAVCIGLSAVAFFTDHRSQAISLLYVSFYIPLIALINMSVAGLTRRQGLIHAGTLLQEDKLPNYPRLVGLYLVVSAAFLTCLMLPISSPSTGC